MSLGRSVSCKQDTPHEVGELACFGRHGRHITPRCFAPGCVRELGWEAATERMLDAGTIRANEWPGPLATAQESVLWSMYNFALGAHALSCMPRQPAEECMQTSTFHVPATVSRVQLGTTVSLALSPMHVCDGGNSMI